VKPLSEIKSAISDAMKRFEAQYMGRGPKDIHVHLIDDLIVVGL